MYGISLSVGETVSFPFFFVEEPLASRFARVDFSAWKVEPAFPSPPWHAEDKYRSGRVREAVTWRGGLAGQANMSERINLPVFKLTDGQQAYIFTETAFSYF